MNADLPVRSVTPADPGWIEWFSAVLSRDYCQNYNWAVKWVRNPLIVLILAAVAAALCGFCLHPQGFIVALGLGALVVVGVAWPSITVLGLRGTVSFDKVRSREGEPVGVRLGVQNRAPWSAWGLAVHSGFGDGTDASLAAVRGWSRTEVAWDFVPECRGFYPSQLPRIASGFPFGLWSAGRGLTTATTLIVWPRTFPVGPIPQVAGGHTSEGAAPRNRPGGSGDFLGVRPYRRGDSLRRVHWPQTARLGQMVICELQSNAVPRVQIVLDTHPAAHAGSGPSGSLEWAIRVAASFVVAWIGEGAEVELVLPGGPITAVGRSVASRRTAFLDALAQLDPTATPLPLADLLAQPACRRFTGGLRLVITTDQIGASMETYPASSNMLAERFVVLRAGAFAPTPAPASVHPLPITPWVWLDDPARVPQQVRRAWKEVSLER